MNVRCVRWALLAAVLPLFGLQPSEVRAQATGTIRGTVIQLPSGEPLPAVQVVVVGTQRGTITARDGTFQIEGVPSGPREIRATFIGFQSQTQSVTVAAGQVTTVSFELRQSILDIEEIIVTGVAGETVRGKIPFTVDRLTQAALPVPASNAASMIQGKVAGAIVTASSGRPGTAPSILLRGPTSINNAGRSQDPLYIVDGVILSASVADIDALDIESIEIVKGAAAASLYGSRAANGVIQITTQRGRNVAENSVRYTFRSEYGESALPGRFNLTQRHQFETQNGKFVSQGGAPCDFLQCPSVRLAGQRRLPGASASAWNTIQQEVWPGQTYDHVERFFQGGVFMSNYASIAGRSGGTNYLVSFSRQDDQGILPYHDGSVRQNFRVNLDQSVRQNLTVSATALYSRSDNSTNEGNIFQLTRMPAGVDLLAPDPNHPDALIIKPDPFNDNINPLYTMSTSQNTQNRGRFLGSLSARWSPLEWANIDANASFDRADLNSQSFRPKGFRNIQGIAQGGSLGRTAQRIEGINASIMGSFRRQFGDLTTLTTLRYLVEVEDSYVTTTSGSEFTADGVWTFSNIPNDRISATSSTTTTRADGLSAGMNLDFRDRYILDGLVRQDGSSRFGPNERRSVYYRMAGAYRLTEEEWFALPNMDEFKLRYSIGTAGNTPSFTAQYETYSVSGGTITPVTLGNRNLKPEFATEQEMGVEMTMFSNRVSVDLTYANTVVKDQILQVPALAYTGFSTQWRNAGTLESNTFEASLNATLVRSRAVTWTARVLFDRTRQEITELNVPAYQGGVAGQGLENVFYYRKGEAIGTFYGFKFATSCADLPSEVDCSQFAVNNDGFLVWKGGASSPNHGWETWQDGANTRHWWGTNAPFTIRGQAVQWGTPFQAQGIDRVTGEVTTFLPLGQTTPDFSVSLANTVSWRNFAFYGLLQSVQGFYVYNQPLQWATFQSYSGIMDQSDVPEELRKPVGYYDRLYGASGLQPSSAFVDDASFVKLREMSVRYRMGRNTLDALAVTRGIESATFSVTGRNLLTWTKYDGYDPDVGASGGSAGSAALSRVDGFSYPNFRTFTFGFEVNF
jgi:TonB-linked SusC/RagA family outer membrane protein